jgi:hypothetical protein
MNTQQDCPSHLRRRDVDRTFGRVGVASLPSVLNLSTILP